MKDGIPEIVYSRAGFLACAFMTPSLWHLEIRPRRGAHNNQHTCSGAGRLSFLYTTTFYHMAVQQLYLLPAVINSLQI
jgi:hypothetical protein